MICRRFHSSSYNAKPLDQSALFVYSKKMHFAVKEVAIESDNQNSTSKFSGSEADSAKPMNHLVSQHFNVQTGLIGMVTPIWNWPVMVDETSSMFLAQVSRKHSIYFEMISFRCFGKRSLSIDQEIDAGSLRESPM
uniref:Uncharacterized protein n=1 Tax=Romanomermis culicivorax TaxID=13658 RepID=A0A915L1G8_ROMCU